MTRLRAIYAYLYRAFGPQYWWPGDTPFEIAVGAILTQNTNWGNVERAIANLKRGKVLSPKAIHEMSSERLAEFIRPSGYFNIKAERLKSFIDFLIHCCHGDMSAMRRWDMGRLRESLLQIKGIGPETADSILLYAIEKPVFVIDAYTKRVLSRHGIMEHSVSYAEFQELFHKTLKRDVKLFNEYHALLVRAGKTYCKRKIPLCGNCPLNETVLWPVPRVSIS